MALGIQPTVDFAFKKMLGSPEHTSVTVHFLNSVLGCSPPIVSVEILNPILEPELEGDKLAVLDALAIDENGRRFNIEMQTSLPAGLTQRLVYYSSSLYAGQLGSGESYLALRPAICICVLERPLLDDLPELQSDFRLRTSNGRTLSDDLQVHLLELSKSRAGEHNIQQVSAVERWAYFLKNASRYTATELQAFLPEREFLEAFGVLEMITRSPQEQLAYDARLKFLRDETTKLESARLEGERIGLARGMERGLEQGLEKGLEQGLRRGLTKGREEGLEQGKEIGSLVGKIQLLEQLLNLPSSDEQSLLQLEPAALAERLGELQRKIKLR